MERLTGLPETLLDEIRAIASRHGVERLILFGSRARGDFKRASDIDLAASGGDIPAFALDVDEKTWTLLRFDVVNLDGPVQPELREAIAREGNRRSAAEIALRWLWDQPEVTCVLSGMNSLAMLEENCRIASETLPGSLTEADHQLIARLRDAIRASVKVGCTGCGYCMPCPQGVDIPGAFRCYNTMFTEGKGAGRHEYFQTVALRKAAPFPSQCIGCGKCEKHCPQHLPIIQELKEAERNLRPLPYRAAMKVARWWLFDRKRNTQKNG